jgi:hypothetical protein
MNIEFDEPTHTYRVDGRIVPSVTQILGDTFPGVYAGIPEHTLLRRAQIGSAVHKAIELYLCRNLDENKLHPEVEPLFKSWRKWWDTVVANVQTWSSESRFGSPLGYAGCDDFFAQICGDFWEIDWKTTTEPKRTHRIQTAGYCIGRGHPAKTRRACLYCQRDGSIAQLVEHTDSKDTADWLAIWRVYNLKGQCK